MRTLVVLSVILIAPMSLVADEFKVIRSAKSGRWSTATTWMGGKVPGAGARVQIQQGHTVVYDVCSKLPIRFIHVAGKLTFARDRDTRLDVGLLRIQPGKLCSEEGFACDAEPSPPKKGQTSPALEVGTPDHPIPARFTARIRLVYFKGMDRNSLPALVCCGGRMDLHGAPMNRTWVELGKTSSKGDRTVVLSESVQGWRMGDQVIVTGAKRVRRSHGIAREDSNSVSTERRRIVKIDGRAITLDEPLQHDHWGKGDYRSEIANLSRNVIVESADPKGERGHTMYHVYSSGAISYAEFRHLGKENVLGRYAIHFHLVGSTMRGSYVRGVAIWDSHNRWVTIHGTNHLIVRDCVGYRSVGHGFFLEDGTEVYNVLDRNLAVHAYQGKPLPKQALPFDPNDGAGFWWANGRNTFIRNVACENHRYGFRYDSQRRSNFDSNLKVLMPDGSTKVVDIRRVPFYRFENNEAHTEGLYGVVVAGTDMVSPDTRHPHMIKNQAIWSSHYALRPQVPKMWIENLKIRGATYGIYRAEVDHHVYRNVYLSHLRNRAIGFAGRADGHGRGGIQHGPFTHDGLTIENSRIKFPFVCMNMTSSKPGQVAHFRRVTIKNSSSRRNMVDIQPTKGGLAGRSKNGVTYYFHDALKKGEVIKVVSTRFPQLLKGAFYHTLDGFTGENVKATVTKDVTFPKLLDPIDDLPPASVVTFPQSGMTVKRDGGALVVHGTTTDNQKTRRVLVNGVEAKSIDHNFHRWEARLRSVRPGRLVLNVHAVDEAGNVERVAHRVVITVK